MPSTGCVSETKKLLSSTPVLVLYDLNAKTTMSANASSHGVGAVLLQEQVNGDVKQVSYISRLLSPMVERYAQVEKEALAFTWACEHFSDFLVGLKFVQHETFGGIAC